MLLQTTRLSTGYPSERSPGEYRFKVEGNAKKMRFQFFLERETFATSGRSTTGGGEGGSRPHPKGGNFFVFFIIALQQARQLMMEMSLSDF